MARLPTPGSDDGTWGDILNEFLSQEHNADGSQKTLPIDKGGTGATDAATARINLIPPGTYIGTRGEMYDTFTNKADGPLTVSDSGHEWIAFADPLSIIGGKLTRVRPTTTPKAGYAQAAPLAGPITRIGGRFVFPAYTGDPLQGSVNMLVPLTDYAASWPFLPPLGLHWSTSPSFWDLNVFESIGGASATPVAPALASGYYNITHTPALVADGVTEYQVDIFRFASTLVMDITKVSDGVSMLAAPITITDSRIASQMGTRPIWENFINGNPDYTNGSLGAWTQVWADSSIARTDSFVQSRGESKVSLEARAVVATSSAIAQVSPFVVEYQNTDGTNIAIPSPSLVAISTSAGGATKNGVAVGAGILNLDFTVPLTNSGKVLVELSGWLACTAGTSADINWALKIGTSTLLFRRVLSVGTGDHFQGIVSMRTLVTGLTLANGYLPGSTKTFDWYHSASVASAGVFKLASSQFVSATMKVTPIP